MALDPKPFDEMTPKEKRAFVMRLRKEQKTLKPDPMDNSGEILRDFLAEREREARQLAGNRPDQEST